MTFGKMFGRLFSSNANRRNNEKVGKLLHDRASKLPSPFDATFRNIALASYCVIEQLYARDQGKPRLIEGRLEDFTPDQFAQLYHATIWSFAALHAFEHADVRDLILRSCEVFAGPRDRYSDFGNHIRRVEQAGGIDFLSMKLHARYREIFGLPPGGDPGFLVMIPLMTSAMNAFRNATR